jgi:TP53 regulating kinase-like protein
MCELKVIGHGAEAKIYASEDVVIKYRMKKGYRIEAIDERLRKKRTSSEKKIIKKLNLASIPSPKLVDGDECKDLMKKYGLEDKYSVCMEHIKGETLKDFIGRSSSEELREMLFEFGKMVARIQEMDIIHGDITSMNFIIKDGIIHVPDFRLSHISPKEEDKAVDLYVFERGPWLAAIRQSIFRIFIVDIPLEKGSG